MLGEGGIPEKHTVDQAASTEKVKVRCASCNIACEGRNLKLFSKVRFVNKTWDMKQIPFHSPDNDRVCSPCYFKHFIPKKFKNSVS